MKQRKPMKRAPFRRQRKDGPAVAQPSAEWKATPLDAERPRNRAPAVSTVKPITRGTYVSTSTVARPKPVEHRNPRLLAMAEKKPCLLRIVGICNNDQATTVACHSNQSKHGKAGARKADDQYSVWGCSACHWWLDFGPAPGDVKAMAFDLAHVDQVARWKEIAVERKSSRDKRAASWALLLVGAPGGYLA